MIIKKTRIRNLKRHLSIIKEGTNIFLGVPLLPDFIPVACKIGFTDELKLGETVLPRAIFGPFSRYNANGLKIALKDKPMETAYRQIEWHWKDWGGYDHWKIVDVPYKRYPRKLLKPPSIELQIKSASNGSKFITIPEVILYTKQNYDNILHIINLFLEIFKECEIFEESLSSISKVPVKRLNWEVLPKGRYPWKKVKKDIDPLLKNLSKGKYPVIVDRLSKISSREPGFVAIGTAGFYGYVVFGFKDLDLYIFESIYYGNATYVFNKDWETLSQFTKAQILDEDLQKYRIIHREGWGSKIDDLFGITDTLKLVS